MPQIICPHCGKAFDAEQGPPPPMAYATPSYYQPLQANGLAIASFVLALTGLVLPVIPGIAAIVLGIMGIKKTRDPGVGGKGLAIAGVCVGAASIFLSVGAVLFFARMQLQRAQMSANVLAQQTHFMKMQQTMQAQQMARSQQMQQQVRQSLVNSSRLRCATNMTQIGMALGQYAQANGRQYPPRLEDLASTHYITRDVLSCPGNFDMPLFGVPAATQTAAAPAAPGPYIYVPNLSESTSADTVVLYEPLSNHGDGMNVLYKNSHVVFLEQPTAAAVIAELKAGFNPPRRGHY